MVPRCRYSLAHRPSSLRGQSSSMAAAMVRARSGVYAHRLIVGAGRGIQIDAHCVIGPAPPPACSRRYGALIAAATPSSLRQVGPLSLASVSSPAGRLTPYRVATRIHSLATARRCYVGGASPLARAWAPRAPSVGPTREQVTTGPSPAVVVAPGAVAASMQRWAHAPWWSSRRCTAVHRRRWERPLEPPTYTTVGSPRRAERLHEPRQ